MKLIIAGSRTVDPLPGEIWSAIRYHFLGVDITEIVSGTARGADIAGELYAKDAMLPVARFPVTDEEYKAHGRHLAPKLRNRRMAEYADAALIFWDGASGGSADMCCRMVARGKPVRVVPMRKAQR